MTKLFPVLLVTFAAVSSAAGGPVLFEQSPGYSPWHYRTPLLWKWSSEHRTPPVYLHAVDMYPYLPPSYVIEQYPRPPLLPGRRRQEGMWNEREPCQRSFLPSRAHREAE